MNTTIAPLTAREEASILCQTTALRNAMNRRQTRMLKWFFKTGAMPPIQRQRARWFREAMERRVRLEEAGRM
jgi:hypothetical protein